MTEHLHKLVVVGLDGHGVFVPLVSCCLGILMEVTVACSARTRYDQRDVVTAVAGATAAAAATGSSESCQGGWVGFPKPPGPEASYASRSGYWAAAASFQGGWVGFPKLPGPWASFASYRVTDLLLLLSKAAGWGSPSGLGHRHHVCVPKDWAAAVRSLSG